MKRKVLLAVLILILLLPMLCFAGKYPTVKVLTTCYFAERWSDQGAYRKVSKNGKRLGNFVALNFLPSGSVIMIPSLFKTTKFEVADTLKGKGRGYFRGKSYWKVDILRNENEWIDDFDRPQDLQIVKINRQGRFRDQLVRENYQTFIDNLD